MIKGFISKHPHLSLLNFGAFLIALGGNIAGSGIQIYPIAFGISLILSAICLQAEKDML